MIEHAVQTAKKNGSAEPASVRLTGPIYREMMTELTKLFTPTSPFTATPSGMRDLPVEVIPGEFSFLILADGTEIELVGFDDGPD